MRTIVLAIVRAIAPTIVLAIVPASALALAAPATPNAPLAQHPPIAAVAATEGCSVVADATTGRASAALLAGVLRRHESSPAATILRPTRPNVVLIVADDQAFDDFGFLGSTAVQTPNLDRLAAQGAVFARGYVPSSLCRPSLMSIVTGLFPHQHGVTGNDPPRGVPRERLLQQVERHATLPRLLAAHGYRCLQTGKWWEGDWRRGGFTAGMTHGDPRRGGRHGDDGLRIGRKTMQPILDLLDEESTAPFFVWFAPMLPHEPHDAPDRLLARERQRAPRDPEPVLRYRAACAWFDEACGTLLDALEQRGLERDTLVLLVCDNGWAPRPGGGFDERSKRSAYERGVRTPIVLRWPGRVTPGSRADVVSSLDLAPTVLRACGVPVPDVMQGADLVAIARGAGPARAGVFGALFEHDVVDLDDPRAGLRERYTVQGRHKLIVPADAARAVELYDVVADPLERRDVAADEPALAATLAASIDDWWPVPRRARRPNLLVLLTDDQRADALSCAGHPVLRTPNLDALAARGVRFTDACVTTSICAASRASILTALHEGTHGYTFGTPPLAEAHATYPRLLRDAGYRTGFVGKLGVDLGGRARAEFDAFVPLSLPYEQKSADGRVRHLTDRMGDEAIAFLRERDRARPFCLSVSFHAPHADDGDPRQYVWPAALDGLYDDVPIAPPPLSEPEFFEALPAFQQQSLNRVRWFWRFDTEEKRVRMTRGWYRMISGVDAAVGRILAELRRLELDQSTVVLFSSDNGYFLGERGFAGKWLIHDVSVRVPLIVADPRARPARRGVLERRLVLNLDVAPTLLDLAGVAVPAPMQGRSLVPLLRGEPPPDWRRDTFYEHRFAHAQIPKSEGVRDARWTFVRYYEQEPVHEELYDRAADPHESRNVVAEPAYAADAARLRARCDELRARYVSPR